MARRRGSGHGGYRAPASPAAVSGPGALSQRTDSAPPGEFTGLDYGENKAVNDQMDAAPTQPQQGGVRSARGGARLPDGGVFGATGRPDEPMTAGVDAGPGAGATRGLGPIQDVDIAVRAHIRAMQDHHPDIAEYLLGLTRG